MTRKINILGINGSASNNAANLAILKQLAAKESSGFNLTILEDLTVLPHFKTELTTVNTPKEIVAFRKQIENAEGVLICTPEYVFSIPSGLKNAIEWCVSTTVFLEKPVGLVTASASGEKAHTELQLIMETLQAKFTKATTLLVRGVKGKVSQQGEIIDSKLEAELDVFIQSFKELIL